MKSFSELTSASQVNNGDLLAISQTSGSGYASKKTTVKDITDKSNLNLAEEYDSTSTYAVDDYVIYESVLYKCIGTTTGTFDSTKWTSVVVTDEMGSGGGGGTGGHTIIDENGNSMTARAGLQFVGGANVSDDSTNNKTIVDLASAGGIDGVFIDTNNVIVNTTTISASGLSYTATEDCFAYIYLWGSQSTKIMIDGIEIGANYSTDKDVYLIPLKKGQVLTTTAGNSNNTYQIYGIQTGTTHSKFQPVIYSLEEREIGVWTDGKPLYQKTINVGSLITGDNVFNHGISNLEKIVSAFGRATRGSSASYVREMYIPYSSPVANWDIGIYEFSDTTGYVNVGNAYNGDYVLTNCQVTLQYTKSSDTAGSGSWTPQGVPAVHYSTDEQIIGTYFGNTLYQKSWNSLNIDVAYNSWTNVVEVDSNVNEIIDVEILAATTEKHNITGSGIEYYLDKNSHYVRAEYNQNINRRNIGTITLKYTKSS